MHSGNTVRFPTPEADPQGAWLSKSAPHKRSGGHMNATGPISCDASSPWSCERASLETRPREKNKCLRTTMLDQIVNIQSRVKVDMRFTALR